MKIHIIIQSNDGLEMEKLWRHQEEVNEDEWVDRKTQKIFRPRTSVWMM